MTAQERPEAAQENFKMSRKAAQQVQTDASAAESKRITVASEYTRIFVAECNSTPLVAKYNENLPAVDYKGDVLRGGIRQDSFFGR
eukprot:4494394-Pyramimonas_sp.AAC.1